MRTVSSYGVEIRKQNIPVRQTMEIYRQAVGYLTEIYAQVWEEQRKIPETKKRFNRAQAIIAYRQENGPFAAIEDIMNVQGIKEGTFAKIKDEIVVG